jgi:glycosyltransferase involved in cell wall biosynthesis
MKVALLSYEYPPETGFGGIGTYTWHHARGLRDLGHEVHVIAGLTGDNPELLVSDVDGLTVWRYQTRARWEKLIRAIGRLGLGWTRTRIENGINMYRAFREIEKDHQFDILEMPECGAEGLLINRLTPQKTVIKLHSPAQLIMKDYDVNAADYRLCSLVERSAMNGTDYLTSPSDFLAREAESQLGIGKSIRIIPNGIDVEWFDGIEEIDARRRFNLPRDRVTILFAGRMESTSARRS